MVTYQEIVEKLKRRISKDEWVNGVSAYVNDPNFPELYNRQISLAIERYKEAGAPETWATKQSLKLRLISADEWKSAITAEGVADRYYNKLMQALDLKEKMFAIPAEQDNTITDIITELDIMDTKKRMLVAYDVGQHFEKAVLYKLAGDSENYNNEVTALINDLVSDGIIPTTTDESGNTVPNQEIADKVKQIIDTRVTNCITILTS